MSNYCSANSEGELFPFFVLMPFGFCLILVLSFIAYKFHLFKYFDKIVFTKIHPLLIYILGIPVVFLLSITGVYSNPTSISASGSDTLSARRPRGNRATCTPRSPRCGDGSHSPARPYPRRWRMARRCQRAYPRYTS